MKKISAYLLVIIASIATITSAAVNPTVPLDVAIKGRQAVTDWLNHQIDHVQIKYKGDSVVVPSWQETFLNRDTLRGLGYEHDGSFAEFSQAIYSIAFSGDVVVGPNGYYDVRTDVEVLNVDNETVLSGDGYLNIYRDDRGELQVGMFEPYLNISQTINITIPGGADAAKWVSQFGGSRELELSWDNKGNVRIVIPTSLLNNGNLLYTKDGHIVGHNLKSGETLSGKHIYALLGNSRSDDTEVLRDPEWIDSSYYQFQQYGNQVVGRFPLRNVVLSQGKMFNLSFGVPVWGSSKKMIPSRIWVTQLYATGASKLDDGVEYEIPMRENGTPNPIYLPAGEFIIRTEFEGLVDWDELYAVQGTPVAKG